MARCRLPPLLALRNPLGIRLPGRAQGFRCFRLHSFHCLTDTSIPVAIPASSVIASKADCGMATMTNRKRVCTGPPVLRNPDDGRNQDADHPDQPDFTQVHFHDDSPEIPPTGGGPDLPAPTPMKRRLFNRSTIRV